MVSNQRKSEVKHTSWPESCPNEGEEYFISVGCGNTTINWGLHHSVSKDDLLEMKPKITWTTPHLMKEDVDDSNLPILLASLLPRELQDHFFGVGDNFTEAAAKDEAKKRNSDITFYIISSNVIQSELIGCVLSCIPCRVYQMKGEDFYPESWGRYKGMGADRCACLKGSVAMFGAPVLVIDGGTAVTYTGIDAKGEIMGGGICPGLNSKFRAMNQDTGALPLTEVKYVLDVVKNAIEHEKPLPIFSKETKEAMIVAVLGEVSAHFHTVVKYFLERVKDGNSENIDNKACVVCTGGSGELISKLLGPQQVLEFSNDSNTCRTIFVKSLLHIGVAAALQEQIKENHIKKMNHDSDSFSAMIGRRVAKYFEEPSPEDNDHIYRGTVKDIRYDNDVPLFQILYDDSDFEELRIADLNDAIKLFEDVGEKNRQTFVDKRIAKIFNNDEVFFGTVVSCRNQFFQIMYDDGDEEEYDMNDMQQALELYGQEKSGDKS